VTSVEDLHGWRADPYGQHEDRYFSQGQPTRLVRDGGRESYDDPPTVRSTVSATRLEERTLPGVLSGVSPSNAAAPIAPSRASADLYPGMAIVERLEGWQPDPYGHHEYRYFVGGNPTAHVSDAGQVSLHDPSPGTSMFPASPPETRQPVHSSNTSSSFQGWTADPYRRHEHRYFSQGRPTAHVSDAGIQSEDQPPVEEPWRSDPSGPREYRYFEQGLTSFVNSGGLTLDDDLTAADLADTPLSGPSTPTPGTSREMMANLHLVVPASWFSDPVDPNHFKHGDRLRWTVDAAPTSQSTPEPEPEPEVEPQPEAELEADPEPEAEPELEPEPQPQPQPEPEPAPQAEAELELERSPEPAPAQEAEPLQQSSTLQNWSNNRTKIALAALGAMAVVIALLAISSFGKSDKNRLSERAPMNGPVAMRPTTTSSTVLSTTTTSPPPTTSPPINNPVAAWWASAGAPYTTTFATDIQTINNQLGNTAATSGGCHAFHNDVVRAASAPAAPLATIEREWQLTMSTVNRASNACLSGKPTQIAEDLQAASRTIQDLTAQVNGRSARG
jgi:hypothetical protein